MISLRFVVLLLAIAPTATLSSEDCTVDLGLVVDTTKSIRYKNIPLLKDSLEDLVRTFDISPGGTHVSLETFSKFSIVHSKFSDEQYHSIPAVEQLINVSIVRLDSPTRLDLAIERANNTLFTVDNGKRPGTQSVMVLYTDGKSHPTKTGNYQQFVDAIKAKGIRVVVVAIGPNSRKKMYRENLMSIAGKYVYSVQDYKSLKNATAEIRNLICPPMPCNRPTGMDIALVVDKTKSIKVRNFKLLKGFLLEVVDALTISSTDTHVGVILFDKEPTVLNNFAEDNYHSNFAVHRLIENIGYDLGSGTYIDKALEAAAEQLFTEKGGDRLDFPNVLLLITDGKTNEKSQPFGPIVQKLKDKNVFIIAIGVGNYKSFEGELHQIAGQKNTFTVDSFDDLTNLFDKILAKRCEVNGPQCQDGPCNTKRRLNDLLSLERIQHKMPLFNRQGSSSALMDNERIKVAMEENQEA